MVEHVLKASMERDWIITVMYQKGTEITKRNIKVMEMDNNSIVAFCYLRRETRRFRRENILSAAFCYGKSLGNTDVKTGA